MKRFLYFDTHCDTLTKIYNESLKLNNEACMVNLKNMLKYICPVQVFAVFNDGSFGKNDMLLHFDYLKKECKSFSRYIGFVTGRRGIKKNFRLQRASAMLSIEALGNQPGFETGCISDYADCGVKIMSLCWNDDNILCGGSERNISGLTPLGRKVLHIMEEKKIILDVSHMSDRAFFEALDVYTLPVIASHSNSRAIVDNSRNLTDKQFELIKKSGGVCGINFYPPFLGENGITDAIRHIEHFMSLGGENHIGIGADFDGIDQTATGLDNSACVYRLFEALLRLNYKDSTISKIAFYNFYNLLPKFEFKN